VGVGTDGWGRKRGAGYSASESLGLSAASPLFDHAGAAGVTRLPPLVGTAGSATGQDDNHWPFVEGDHALAALSESGQVALPALLRSPQTPVIL